MKKIKIFLIFFTFFLYGIDTVKPLYSSSNSSHTVSDFTPEQWRIIALEISKQPMQLADIKKKVCQHSEQFYDIWKKYESIPPVGDPKRNIITDNLDISSSNARNLFRKKNLVVFYEDFQNNIKQLLSDAVQNGIIERDGRGLKISHEAPSAVGFKATKQDSGVPLIVATQKYYVSFQVKGLYDSNSKPKNIFNEDNTLKSGVLSSPDVRITTICPTD